MSKTVKSTSSVIEYFRWKIARFTLERKQNKLLKFYQNGKYQNISKVIKTQKDYEQITFDEFPFLYFMISQNNIEAIKKFLEKYQHKDSMFMNDNNQLKCTPIQYSLLENKEEVSQVLQQNGGNIHISNSEGQNALHLSTIYKRKQAFDLCIKKNIDFNHVDVFGNTPFHYACRAGSVQMIATLVAAKAKKIANQLHQYPIHMAIQSGKLQCVTILENDILRPYPKYHPIHSAARSNNVQVFKYVYEKNPKLLFEKDENYATPLHHAVSMEDYSIVRFILERLPKNPTLILDAQDSYGNTPTHLAFLNSNLDIIRELVQRKAKLNIKNNDQMTPTDYGLTSEDPSIKRYLMDIQGWKQHGERRF